MATVSAIPHSLFPSPMATVPARTKCPENVCTSPARLTNVYVAPLARLNTAQTPIPSCLHQARYIVLGCGSFVRGRKRKRVDSRPLLYYRGDYTRSEQHTREARRSLPPHQINYPVSQSYIYQTPLVHNSPASIENRAPQTRALEITGCESIETTLRSRRLL